MKKRLLSIILALAMAATMIVGVALTASGSTLKQPIYVDGTSGNDVNDGLTTDNAVKTLKKAVELAGENGTVIVMKAVTLTPDNMGSGSVTLENLTVERWENNTIGDLLVIQGSQTAPMKVTLKNITIDGKKIDVTDNFAALVRLGAYSELNVEAGAKLVDNNGIAVYIYDANAKASMTGGEISGNFTNEGSPDCPGVYVNEGSFEMSGGLITDNTNTYFFGGGVYVDYGSFTMTGGTISENYAHSGGGGVSVNEGAFTMSGGYIIDNVANCNNIEGHGSETTWGGGVYAYDLYGNNSNEVTIVISGGEISGNEAMNGNGMSIMSVSTKTSVSVSGSPKIVEEIDIGPASTASPIKVIGVFTPVNALTVNRWGAVEGTAIATYAEGITPNSGSFASYSDTYATEVSGQNVTLFMTYTVSVTTPTNGTVTTSQTTAAEGDTVTLTVTPNSGYELDTLTVTSGTTTIATTAGENNTYTFTMPEGNVTVNATFKLSHVHALTDGGNELAWIPVDDLSDITGAGNYYLADGFSLGYYDRTIDADGAKVNLCLNGKEITFNYAITVSNVTLSICDCSADGAGSLNCKVENLGTMNLYSGKVVKSITNKENAVLNIHGGSVADTVSNNANAEMNMYGGKLETTNIAITNSGILKISGGTVTSARNAIEAKSGEITVSDTAVIVGTGSGWSTINIYSDAVVNIKGGTVKHDNGSVTVNATHNAAGELNISGGTITSSGKSETLYLLGAELDITITGGTITNNYGSVSYSSKDGTRYGWAIDVISVKTLTISGAPTIDSIYLAKGKTITVGEGGLSNTAPIPVYCRSCPAAVTGQNSADYSSKFTPKESYAGTYSIVNKDNVVWFTKKATVVYTDGVDGKEIFADQSYDTYLGFDTPEFEGTPEREGYTFAGWSPEVAATVDGSVTYEAQWTANEYTVTFDANGGEVDTETKTVTFDSAYGELPAPTLEGYTFADWMLDDETVTSESIVATAKDHTLVAKWTVNQYTITFVVDGKSDISITQDYGTAITVPDDPTRSGYIFDGWVEDIPATMPAENVTINSKWIRHPGSGSGNVTKELFTIQCTVDHDHAWLCNWFGSHVTLVKNSVKWNEELGRWEAQAKTARSMFSQINFSNPKKNYFGGITHHYDTYNYTLDLYYDPDFTGINSEGKEVTGMWLPVKDYVFDVYCYTEPAMPNISKITSKLLWVRDTDSAYKSKAARYTVKQLIADTYTLGEMYAEDGKFYVDLTITDLTPYIDALSEKNNKTYILPEWTNHRTEDDFKFTLVYTGSTTDYKQDGTGWSLDTSALTKKEKNNGVSVWLTEQTTVTYTDGVEDEVIFADQDFTRYTQTENGGTNDDWADFSNTETPTIAAPERHGYTFGGWDPAVPATMPSEDMTFEALWSINDYNVQIVIYLNGNTETPHKTVSLGAITFDTVLNLSEYDINNYYSSANGFEFYGWYNDGTWNSYKAGNNPAGLETITVNGWTNIICMVYNYETVVIHEVLDGVKETATVIETTTALHGTNLIEFLNENVTVPAKEGYTADYWFNKDYFGNKYADDKTVNGWINVYINYVPNTYNITASAEHGTVTVSDTAEYLEEVTVTVEADEHYTFLKLIVDGVDVTDQMVGNEYKFTMPYHDVEISAVFVNTVYDIIVDTEIENGTVTVEPDKAIIGDEITVTITPDKYFELETLIVNGEDVTDKVVDGVYTFTMVNSDVEITATFKAIPTFDITVTEPKNGEISVQGIAAENEIVTITATPAPGYKVKEINVVTLSGTPVAVGGTHFKMPAEAVSIQVIFTVDFSRPVWVTFSGNAAAGETVTLTSESDIGYGVQTVVADENGNYSFTMIKFLTGGTFTFTVEHSETVETVVVTVTDKKDQLWATVTGSENVDSYVSIERDIEKWSELLAIAE